MVYAPGFDRNVLVTDMVLNWIKHDPEALRAARDIATNGREWTGDFVRRWIRGAQVNGPSAGAYPVRMDLAPNDYDRVDWVTVALAVET